MAASTLTDWSRTGATIVSVAIAAVSVIRWTQSVDDRLSMIDTKLNVFITQAQAAAESAKIYAAQAVKSAEDARTAMQQTQGLQDQQIKETRDNRKAVESQSKRVTDLKEEVAKQLEAFSWRMRQLEDQNRRALDKK